MSLRKSTQERVPVLLYDAAGAAATSITPSDINGGNVQLKKGDGTTVSLALTTGGPTPNWIQVDSTNSPGLYEIVLPNTHTDVLGIMTWSLQPAAAAFKGLIGSDTVTDLAAEVAAIKDKTVNLPADPASQAVTSTAIDAARDAVRGAQALDLSAVAGGASFVQATDNLRAIRTSADAATASADAAPAAVWNRTRSLHQATGTFGESDRLQLQSAVGHAKIVNQQLIIYNEDNTQALLTFDLKDIAGLPANFQVTERTKVG